MTPYPYPVLNLPLKLYREVSTVLRYTVLVVRLKHANHVRIVPVRPHSRLGYVVRKELLEPEQPLRGRTSTRIIRYRYPLLNNIPTFATLVRNYVPSL